jgi:lysophospholipase L1-like esterase
MKHAITIEVWLGDGQWNLIHFNATGYDFLGETVAKAIEEQLPKR